MPHHDLAQSILIVEDDPGIAELESERLKEAGYRVVASADSQEALRELRRGTIDLILLDYRLPGGVDGLEFYAHMKSEGYDVPVILVTGFSDEATVIRALRAGVRDFVTKSLEYLDYLPEAVARVLRQVMTERRCAESEARLAGIITSAKDAIIVVEANRRISLFNPAAERMFKCPAASALDRPITDFIPDEFVEPPRCDSHPDALSLSHCLQAKTEGIRADGERFPIETSVSRCEVNGRRFHAMMARDVTSRQRAEAELRRTSDLLMAVVEGTTDAVFVKDRAGRFLLVNEAAARFVGRKAEDVVGQDGAAFFDEASARRIMEMDRQIMVSGETRTHEETLTAAGATKTFSTTHAPYRDRQANVIGVIGISRDVTDRQRLTQERDRLLTRLQLHIERMPLAYILFDADLVVTDWNPAAKEIFGWGKEEMLGRNALATPLPNFGNAPDEILRQMRTGEFPAHAIRERLTRDGRTITCEWFNTPLLEDDGNLTGLLCLVQDVTARRTAEEALRLRDRAIRAVAQGVLIGDASQPDVPIVYASPGFEQLTGYAAAEILGRNCRMLQGKETDLETVAQVRKSMRNAKPCTVELANYKKDGTLFWNELSISPVRDEQGRLTHFVGVQTDVTERRRLEQGFRQSQKMEAFGQLAGGVAHDFNNLLTIINGYGEMLLQMTPMNASSRAMMTEIVKAGERSAGLTRQLLAFSRQQVLAPRILNLNTVVGEIGSMIRRMIGEDIRLATTLGHELWPVRADSGLIEQIVMNLTVNARDAMPQGGQLTIETRNVELDEEYARTRSDAHAGPHVLLAVTDTGHGMTDEVKTKIFEPFFTTKGLGKGTGLGLATVYGIVKQCGGHLAVYSVVGVGTTFKIYFPATEDAVIAAEPVRDSIAFRGTETVLLVEDEEGVRELARNILSRCGYAVLDAANSFDAAQVARSHPGPIHLLMTDVVMPGGGGQAVAVRIAASHPGIRVLFVSGYTDDAVVRHGILHESVNFLQKPFSAAALARKVREVLDGEPKAAQPGRAVESN